MFKLASWNVNSLKIRLDQVLDWLAKSQVDVLALQETKLIDELFPKEQLAEEGFYCVFSGQKTYNGVALISKKPITEVQVDIPDLIDPQRRILATTVAGMRIVNLYVPNGAAVDSEKYQYKLNWLSKVTQFLAEQLKQYEKVAVVGDFNIAPQDIDVHSPKEWEGCVHVSPAERDAFEGILRLGFHDSFRLFPQEDNSFSWWDYRAAGYRRNRGLRIDHVLLNDALSAQCTRSAIDKEPRGTERPSDHAPVWVELDI
ncbi:MAG: exodeoxyribonuclease III [Legionella sp.]|nr:MAG: exodeoxyribonuclease III [Legionella sp.]PJD98457.1 MAG: exodeoxyribonuclease III [Legionella sp.]